MNWNKEIGCSHPPDFTTPVEGQNGAADGGQTTHATNSFADDFMSRPFLPLSSPFPHHDIRRNFQPYSFEGESGHITLSDYMDLNRLADSNTDPNLINATNGRNNTVGADYLMNSVSSSTDYLKSQVQMDCTPPRESASGYPMKACGAEAKTSNISRSQMNGNFPSSLSPLANNFEAIKNDGTRVPFSSDGNFLTLGVGGGTGIRPNRNFSSRGIATKFEEAFPSQSNSSHFGQSSRYPLSHTRMSTCNEGGPIRDTIARPNTVPFPSFRNPQANARPAFFPTNDNFVFDQNPSLPFPRHFPDRPVVDLRPQPSLPTYITSQSISNRQSGYNRNSYMNVLPESSARQFSERHRGSSISHAQLGKLNPLAGGIQTQTGDGVPFPGTVQPMGNLAQRMENTRTETGNIGSFPSRVQPVGTSHNVSSGAFGNSLPPQRTGLQTPRGSSFQSAGGGPFPKRLGVQPIDFSTARTARGNLHPAQGYGPVDYFQRPFRPPSVIGPSPMHLAASLRPLAHPGHVNPTANIGIRPRDSPIVSQPYLKRQATENSPIAQSSHRRKILPQPDIYHSIPQQGWNVPAPIPETDPLHIKWKGFDEPPKVTGHKCLLCKRDLSFTAEGPVFQPTISPAVAVLPCGHTFHDLCLERITPEGQSKEPPCIPCAIGEA